MSRFRSYGRGTMSAGDRRFWRRALHHAANEDPRDIGNRPGVEFILGIDGELEVSIDGLVIHPSRVFVALSHHTLTKRAA